MTSRLLPGLARTRWPCSPAVARISYRLAVELAADPQPSVALAPLRAAPATIAVSLATGEGDLAGQLTKQSKHLAELGRREEGLVAINKAVTLRRRLAAARPDAFEPNLPGR